MKKNLESVAQRGEHIDQLQDKSENLNQSAQGFRRGANRVRKQMWWKNMKMRIWIIVGIIFLLLIIIIPSGESATLLQVPDSRADRDLQWSPRSIIKADKNDRMLGVLVHEHSKRART